MSRFGGICKKKLKESNNRGNMRQHARDDTDDLKIKRGILCDATPGEMCHLNSLPWDIRRMNHGMTAAQSYSAAWRVDALGYWAHIVGYGKMGRAMMYIHDDRMVTCSRPLMVAQTLAGSY